MENSPEMENSPYAMQAKGYTNWPNAHDQYGFSALPVGYRLYDDFVGVGSRASFWSASASELYSSHNAFCWYMDASFAGLIESFPKYFGLAVRCFQDSE
jgi:uncharacterized protein (TIGR02145 family)